MTIKYMNRPIKIVKVHYNNKAPQRVTFAFTSYNNKRSTRLNTTLTKPLHELTSDTPGEISSALQELSQQTQKPNQLKERTNK